MKNNTHRKGNAAGIMLAGIGIIASIIAIAGMRLIQSTARNASASVQSSVRVVQGSINANRRGDRKVLIGGNICFGSHINSGTETGVVTVRNANGVELKNSEGSEHMQKILLTAGSSFPAPCDYTNTETGEAILKNKQSSGNSFNVTATFSQPLSSTYCPDVYLHYNGYNFSGTPFSRIKLSDIDGICPRAPTPTLTPSPTTTQQANPTQTPTPSQRTSGSFEGTITVYSCKKPDYINVVFCDGTECNEDEPLPNSASASENGLWLMDSNNDNSWIYQYKISKNSKNESLDPNKEYTLKGAKVFFGRDFYWSSREQNEKLSMKPSAKRDFEVDASPTCSCTFNATSYIKDPQGNYITSLDGKNGVAGTINNKQRAERPDAPIFNLPFNHLGNNPGRIDVHTDNLSPVTSSHGRDGLASVKLFAPGWKVVGQECKSKNPDVPACPGYTTSWPPTGEDKSKYTSNVFDGLRVTCGTDLEYGWTLLSPTPTPSPTPNLPGRVETGFYIYVNEDDINPPSCELARIASVEGMERYIDDCELALKDMNGTIIDEKNQKNCANVVFENVPPGTYTLDDTEGVDHTIDVCQDVRTFTVHSGETIRIPFVVAFDKSDCDIKHATEGPCNSEDENPKNGCAGVGGDCLGHIVGSELCCVEISTSGDDDGDGGDPQGQCSTALGRACTGTAADNPRYANNPQARCDDAGLGQAIGWCGPGNNACCKNSGSSDPGNPGPGDNPPAPPPNSPPDDPNTICGDSSLGYDSECVTKNQCNYGDVAPHYSCGSSAVCCNVTDINDEPPANPPPGQPGRTVPACPADDDRYTWNGPIENQRNCSNFEDYAGEARYVGKASDGKSMYCCKINKVERPPSLGTCPPSTEYPNYTFGPVDRATKCNTDQGGPGGRAMRAKDGSGYCCQVATPPPADIPAYCKIWDGVYSGTLVACETCKDDGNPGYVAACNLCRRSALNLYSSCAGGSSCSDAADCDDCERNTLSGGAQPLSESCTKCTVQSWACAAHRGSLAGNSIELIKLDFDNNGVINSLDLFYILEDYGIEVKNNVDAVTTDVNSDGFVNALDLSLVVGAFGQETK